MENGGRGIDRTSSSMSYSELCNVDLPWHRVPLFGMQLLRHPSANKGMGFSQEERAALRLTGLLPPKVMNLETQVARVIANLDRLEGNSLEQFIFLTALCDRNETLFYKVLCEYTHRVMPLVYTPTVGLACQQFGHIYRRPRGLFITDKDAGNIRSILRNWPNRKVKVIVVTDGERILGLGDLGCNGMGIPVGKLALYVACAGIHPEWTLPIQIDVGTDNAELLQNPSYIGQTQSRLRGPEYDELIDEFVREVRSRFGPTCLIQWEDFGNTNAFRILKKYADVQCSFNDDIQGTAAVTLAGILSALKVTGKELKDQTFLFLGAGEAGCGIADLIASCIVKQVGGSLEDARKKIWLIDSKGLITANRGNLQEHKLHYAHDASFKDLSLLDAIDMLKPTALIGVSAVGGSFTEEVVKKMGAINEKPIIFALSNPTSCAECTAEQAYSWTDGRAIYASGSPFPEYTHTDGTKRVPGQGNNAYIFPGVGMGVISANATKVTDSMFLVSADALASTVSPDDLAVGAMYPPLSKIRDVSAHVAACVAEEAYRLGVATYYPKPTDLRKHINHLMFKPEYNVHA